MRRSERRLRRDPGRPRLPPVGRLGTPIAASPAEREAARRCRIPSYCPSLSGLAPTCGCPQELLAVASGKAAGLVPTPSLRKALGTLYSSHLLLQSFHSPSNPSSFRSREVNSYPFNKY